MGSGHNGEKPILKSHFNALKNITITLQKITFVFLISIQNFSNISLNRPHGEIFSKAIS